MPETNVNATHSIMTALEEKSGNHQSRSDSSCRDQECLYQEFLPIHLVDIEIFHLKKRPKGSSSGDLKYLSKVIHTTCFFFRYFLDMCRETLLVWLKHVGTEFNLWFSINILPSDKVAILYEL